MSAEYTRLLDRLLRIFMHVEFKTYRRDVVDYSIVLLVEVDGTMETVRLYDEDRAIVLVAADGSTRTLLPEPASH